MKNLKRFAAMVMTGAMVASIFSFSAFAAVPETGTATITKNITKEKNVYAPNTTFEFTITPGTPVAGSGTSKTIYAGPEGGATLASDSIASTPKAADIGQTTVTEGTIAINIVESKFLTPGIYRYNVTEKAGSYTGVAYSQETKYFDVYVTQGTSGLEYNYMFVNAASTIKDDGIFTNDYSSKHDTLNDLTVTKTVAGKQGVKDKSFDFKIAVSGAVGEQYYVVVTNKDKTTTTTTLTSKADPVTIHLTDGASFKVYGLSNDDTYTVSEENYTSDGYTTVVNGNETGTIKTDTTVGYTNTKDVPSPMGVIFNVAPYVLMVVLAGAFAFLFLRKRNNAR